GKSTLLRTIAGLETPSHGEILLDGRLVSTAHLVEPPERRSVGLVFQDYALFPHLTVARNIGYGLHRLKRSARDQRVRELLALVGMPGLGERYPHELSGGQRQRVALARALAPRPSVILLDEPFSNLDAALRQELRLQVRELLKANRTSAILVSHDQKEAFTLADRIAEIGRAS